MEKVYVLDIKDNFDEEEIRTCVFDTLEDFNKARNLLHLWANSDSSILDFFEEHNIKCLDVVCDTIYI